MADITEALQARMAVVVNLKPDHWFSVFPGDGGNLVLIQSYQNLYTAEEWLTASNGGDIAAATFTRDLDAVLTVGDAAAARRLFSRGPADDATISSDFAGAATIGTLYRIGSFKWNKV